MESHGVCLSVAGSFHSASSGLILAAVKGFLCLLKSSAIPLCIARFLDLFTC